MLFSNQSRGIITKTKEPQLSAPSAQFDDWFIVVVLFIVVVVVSLSSGIFGDDVWFCTTKHKRRGWQSGGRNYRVGRGWVGRGLLLKRTP